MNYLSGYKVYICSVAGIAIILAHHYLGFEIQGVEFNEANWLSDIYQLVLLMAGRSAMPDKKGIS